MSEYKEKKPTRWPADQTLANSGFVKRLYDRILSKKDRVSKRLPNGRAVMDYRKPTILKGVNDGPNVSWSKAIDADVREMSDSAIGYYRSDDCEVYIVSVAHNVHVAEALKDNMHIWSTKKGNLESLLREVYTVFPKDKPTEYKMKTDPTVMDSNDLEHLLKRKKVEEREESGPNMDPPSADVSPEEIAAAHNPAVIAADKAQEEVKEIPYQ